MSVWVSVCVRAHHRYNFFSSRALTLSNKIGIREKISNHI